VISIYEVHMDGGAGDEHIAAVRWQTHDRGTYGESTAAEIIEWLSIPARAAYVRGSTVELAPVRIVDGKPPHIRTWSETEGAWSDGLLALPRH
jgi:hypothetical protein